MFKSLSMKAAVAGACLAVASTAMADGAMMFGSDLAIGPSSITTTQGGLLYGYNSCYGGAAACVPGGEDWHYYYSNDPWYVTGFDEFGLMEGTNGAPAAAGSYYGLTMTAPGAVNATLVPFETTTVSSVAPKVNVSDAKSILVKMGNFCGPVGCPGTANVLTVVVSNGTNTLTPYTDPRWDSTATALCSADVTLAGQGDGAFVGPGSTARLHSMYTYKINTKSFKCTKGNLSKALSALTAVSVEVRQDKNAAAMASGDGLQMIAVSRVSFSK